MKPSSATLSSRCMLRIIALMGGIWSIFIMSLCFSQGRTDWIVAVTDNPNIFSDMWNHFSLTIFLLVGIFLFLLPFGTLRCILLPASPVWDQAPIESQCCFCLGFSLTNTLTMTIAKVWISGSLPSYQWMIIGLSELIWYGCIMYCENGGNAVDGEGQKQLHDDGDYDCLYDSDDDDLCFLLLCDSDDEEDMMYLDADEIQEFDMYLDADEIV